MYGCCKNSSNAFYGSGRFISNVPFVRKTRLAAKKNLGGGN